MLTQIVLPVYNAESTISCSVESVIKQTNKNWILTVVDDGSTDHTRELIAPYLENPQIKYIYQSNSGPGAARNTAINLGCAFQPDIFAFIDADDCWHPRKLQYQIDTFLTHPWADVVVTDSANYHSFPSPFYLETRPPVHAINNLFTTLCTKDFPFHPASAAIKSSLFERARYTETPQGEDFFPFLYWSLLGRNFLRLKAPLYIERSLPGSLQRTDAGTLFSGESRLNGIQRLKDEHYDLLCSRCHNPATLVAHAKKRFYKRATSGARACLTGFELIRYPLFRADRDIPALVVFTESLKCLAYAAWKITRTG
ncbi:glycosyltransferase family A protein [Halorhodospira halophila]|uniref:glycosyltransferase family 2 protein n=1 Tax=Halorhodospira TaxID=85108 RepID=UPI001EE820F1|nr:glycosyltransferase family 2 protein [Halorhodospira halophila]MCG5542126.1 glycosyltransferase family 2 protein [Halorhodospira sp. 9628]